MGVKSTIHLTRKEAEEKYITLHLQSDGKITKKHPVIAFRTYTIGACSIALRRAYDSNMEDVSIATKKFCDEFHSYSVVAKMWSDIYETVTKGQNNY